MNSTPDKRATKTAGAKLREVARHDPAATFDTPMDVVKTPLLPADDKQRALESWEQDEKALQRATEEGMGGGEPPRLRSVRKAGIALDERTKAAKPG